MIPRYLGQKANFINLFMPKGEAQDNLTAGRQEVRLLSYGMPSLCALRRWGGNPEDPPPAISERLLPASGVWNVHFSAVAALGATSRT